MREYRNYLLLFYCVINFSGCTKLDQKVYDTQNTNNVKTQTDVEVLIYGLYGQLQAWNGFKQVFPLMLPPYADDLFSTLGSASFFGTKKELNSGYSNFYNVWTGLYDAIANANNVIRLTNSLNLDPGYKAQALAEAKFFRGLCHFYLVQYFGPVPISTESYTYQSDFKPKRNSVDSVYQQIFADLNEAARNLPLKATLSSSNYTKATQGAAQAFLAKAYLVYGNYLDLSNRSAEANSAYSNAKANADSVIKSLQFSLLPDFAKLWDVNNKKEAYKEVVFGVSFSRDNVDNGVGSSFASYLNPQSRANISGRQPQTSGLGWVKVHPWFYDKYTDSSNYPSASDYVVYKSYAVIKKDTVITRDTDYRVQTSFLTSWTFSSSNPKSNGLTCVTYPFKPGPASNYYLCEPQPYINKYVDPDGIATDANANDLFLMRFSELYLIYAEAENEMNGPTTAAISYFNQVRKRARGAGGTLRLGPADLAIAKVPTKQAMRMKIFDERGLEFVGELNRWFDLVRMRCPDNVRTMYQYQFETFLPKLSSGLPEYKNKVWSSGRTEASNIIPFDKKYLLFPVPANEIAVNGNLLPNNYGW